MNALKRNTNVEWGILKKVKLKVEPKSKKKNNNNNNNGGCRRRRRSGSVIVGWYGEDKSSLQKQLVSLTWMLELPSECRFLQVQWLVECR